MKNHLFFFALLLLLGTQTKAQQPDTITVISTDTITSGYTTSYCTGGGCIYNLPVVIPPGFTIVDIRSSFNYRALGTCVNRQGGFIISLDSCKTLCNYCLLDFPGSCILSNLSIYDSVKACLPAPGCVSDTINFVLDFFRDTMAGGGCGFSCIIGDGPWTISVIGSIDTCTTSVIEHLNTNPVITISPNPATNLLTIHTSLHTDKPATVFITNVLGQTVSQSSIFNLPSSINISSLPPGMYFLELKSESGNMVKRFVKE